MGCPHWVSRQCWAFVAAVFTGIFLVIALALPWFNIAMQDQYAIVPPNGQPIVGQGDAVIVLYWPGAYVQYTPKDQDAEHFTINWDDLSDSKPKNFYMATMGLSIIALILCAGVGFSILFCLMIRSFRQRVDECCAGWTKWVIFAFAVILFIFGLVSWALFFGITSGLKDANFNQCGGHYWCDSFLGEEKIDESLGGGHIYWGPSVGWIFGILANAGMVFVLVLVLATKGHHHHYTQLGADY
jgi:hypothetical protein